MRAAWDSLHSREATALVVLRAGLAWFIFVWAVNKLLVPGQYQRIWGYFYGIELDAAWPLIMGSAQIAICAAIVLGFWRVVSYALGFAMHAVTCVVIFAQLAAPFAVENGYPSNRNASIALAALAGFAALWLLRHRDHWSLDRWLESRKRQAG